MKKKPKRKVKQKPRNLKKKKMSKLRKKNRRNKIKGKIKKFRTRIKTKSKKKASKPRKIKRGKTTKIRKIKIPKFKKQRKHPIKLSFQKVINFMLQPFFRAYDDFREKRKIEKLRKIAYEAKERERQIKKERRIRNENKKTEVIEKILDLKILDPSMGSGHFLVGAVEYLAKRICEIENNDERNNFIEKTLLPNIVVKSFIRKAISGGLEK